MWILVKLFAIPSDGKHVARYGIWFFRGDDVKCRGNKQKLKWKYRTEKPFRMSTVLSQHTKPHENNILFEHIGAHYNFSRFQIKVVCNIKFAFIVCTILIFRPRWEKYYFTSVWHSENKTRDSTRINEFITNNTSFSVPVLLNHIFDSNHENCFALTWLCESCIRRRIVVEWKRRTEWILGR